MKEQKPKRTNEGQNRIQHIFILAGVIILGAGIIMLHSSVSSFYNDIKYFNIKENSNISFDVKLLENDFYDNTKLKENQSYPGSLINNIETNYNYKLETSEKSNISYTYNIDAIITGKYSTSNNISSEVWEKQYEIVPNMTNYVEDADEINIENIFLIDYQKYNQVVNDFKKTLKLSIDTELSVVMTIKYSGNIVSIGSYFDGTKIIKMKMPITSTVTKIKTEYEPEIKKI